MSVGYDIGVSMANASSAGVTAPLTVTGGGGKTNTWIILSIVAFAGIIIALVLGSVFRKH